MKKAGEIVEFPSQLQNEINPTSYLLQGTLGVILRHITSPTVEISTVSYADANRKTFLFLTGIEISLTSCVKRSCLFILSQFSPLCKIWSKK